MVRNISEKTYLARDALIQAVDHKNCFCMKSQLLKDLEHSQSYIFYSVFI